MLGVAESICVPIHHILPQKRQVSLLINKRYLEKGDTHMLIITILKLYELNDNVATS
jgi:hypothetical protein